MKSILRRSVSATACAVLVGLGLLIAGLGASVLVLLAFFGLAAAGLALLAAPFAQMVRPRDLDPENRSQATATI